jgi:ABC-2 type transport system permease protein
MNRRRLFALARAEWTHIRRDVRSLVVILVLPVFMLLLYGYGINYDLDHIPFAVWNLDGTQVSRDLVEEFRQSRYFDLRENVLEQGRIGELLDRGEVVFVLVIPPDLGKTLGAEREAQVQFILDGSDVTRASVALGYIEGALSDFSSTFQAKWANRQAVAIAPPFTVQPIILYNPDLRSRPFIVPGLIAILLTLLAALLTSTTIVREREWGSFESLIASPAHAGEIMLGKMIPYVIIAFFDVVLSFLAGWIVFHVAPAGSVALLLAASAVYLVASLGIGLFFSAVARTQQMAILFAILLTFLPTILLSGFVFPQRSMPWVIAAIGQIFPATHFLIIIRDLYLKAAGLAILWPRLLVLVGYAVVIVAAAARAFHKRL